MLPQADDDEKSMWWVMWGQTCLLQFDKFLGFKLCFFKRRGASASAGPLSLKDMGPKDFRKKYTALSGYAIVHSSVSTR